MVRYDIYWKLARHSWDTKQLGNINNWIINRVVIFQLFSHVFFCKLKVSRSFHINVHIHGNVIPLHFIIYNILKNSSLEIKAHIVIIFFCTRFSESSVMHTMFLIRTLNLKLHTPPNNNKYEKTQMSKHWSIRKFKQVNMSLTSNKSCFNSSIFKLSPSISFFRWLKFNSELCLNFTNSIHNFCTYCT